MSSKLAILATQAIVSMTVFFATNNAYAGWSPFQGQDFALPIEKELTFGYLINKYFHMITTNIGGMNLYQAAFYLMFLLAIVRFLFNQSALKDFLLYVVMIAFLVLPLPRVGKSVPIFFADLLDTVTIKIIGNIGWFGSKYIGQGIGLVNGTTFAEQYAYREAKNDLLAYKRCYRDAQIELENQGMGKATSYTDPKLDSVFSQIVSPQGETCDIIKARTLMTLRREFEDGWDRFIDENIDAGLPTEELIAKRNIITAQLSSNGNDEFTKSLLEKGVKEVTDQKEEGFFEKIFKSGGLAAAGGLLAIGRFIIGLIGMTTLWIFDYYIYEIVTIIKTIAAMGIAFGVLYFMFSGNTSMILAPMGIWMFGNAMYIISAMGMSEFYSKVDKGLGNIALTILGAKNAFMDGLFSLALIGAIIVPAAGILTWKGMSFSASFLTSNAFSIPNIKIPAPKK